MLLSIIIPVYNVEPYLRECLDSVFVQDLADCEVIAVNDGSTDGSRAILEEYKERYPDVLTIVDKANGGLSSARNAGVERAKGDYMYFVDSDDWLKPHAVETIRKAVSGDREADVVYFDCLVTIDGNRGRFPWADTDPMTFKDFFFFTKSHGEGLSPNAVSYVYSSSYWKKAGLHFEEGIKYEDALFKYQLFVREDGRIKAIHVEEPFYVYRIGREGSISTNLTLKNFTDKQYIRKVTDNLWISLGIDDVTYYHQLFDASAYMFYEAYKSGFIGEKRKYWDCDDLRIMRKGVTNEREFGMWLLARLSPKWMARYYSNDLPDWKRRMTNVMLSVIKSFYKS